MHRQTNLNPRVTKRGHCYGDAVYTDTQTQSPATHVIWYMYLFIYRELKNIP